MTHGITATDKVAYAGEGAWHGLGEVFEEGVTLRTLVTEAAPWTVSKAPMYVGTMEVPDLMAMIRDDNGAYLGAVGPDYEVFQPEEGLAFLESLFEDGFIAGATAGSLFGGKQVFMSLKLSEDMKIAGDIFQQYIMLRMGFDGKVGVDATPTNVRVVCNNTVSAAIATAKADRHFKIRHTRNMRDRLAVAREALKVTVDWNSKLAQWMELNATVKMDAEEVDGVIDGLFGTSSVQAENKSIRFIEEFMNEEFRRNGPTKYSMFNAVTGFANHAMSYRMRENSESIEERRLISLVDGNATDFIRKGVALLQAV